MWSSLACTHTGYHTQERQSPFSLAWWHMPVILPLRGLGWEDGKFQDGLGSIVRACLKKKKGRKRKALFTCYQKQSLSCFPFLQICLHFLKCCSIHSFVWLLLLSALEIRWCGVCLDSSVLCIATFYFVASLYPGFLPIQLLLWGPILHLWTRSSNQFFKNFGIWYKRHWNLGSQGQRTRGEALIASNLSPRDPLRSQTRVRVDSLSMVKTGNWAFGGNGEFVLGQKAWKVSFWF